jgi:hypothetical protein
MVTIGAGGPRTQINPALVALHAQVVQGVLHAQRAPPACNTDEQLRRRKDESAGGHQ